MKHLLLIILATLMIYTANAQCSAGFTYVTSGLTVTCTNTCTYTSSPNIIVQTTISDGIFAPVNFPYSTTKSFTYPAAGTWPVRVYIVVRDSSTLAVICSDSISQLITYTQPPCNVSISKSQSGNTVTFTANNLAGTPGMTYNWNFGDGNTGTGASVTHTYSVNGNYTVTLTGSSISASCSKTATTSVIASSTQCNVFITYVKNGNTVVFTASNPMGTPGVTYSWNFGDGNIGTGSPVTHTYSGTGTFYVSVVASSTIANCSKTAVNYVFFPPPPPNIITGNVVSDSTVQDSFKVWLIKFDSTTNILYAVDSTLTSTGIHGYYVFPNQPIGYYRTKAARINAPTSGTGYVPTYHTSSLYWNTANEFFHYGNATNGIDILMQTGTLTSGPGFVGGNVTMGANKGTSGGIGGMLVFLRDNTGKLISHTYTDANGDYSFSNIGDGIYDIHVEEGGFMSTPSGSFIINTYNTSFKGLDFEKHDVARTITPKATGIINIAANKLGIYPNPANGKVHISLGTTDLKLAVSMTDVSGRNVYRQNINLVNGQADLNISQLQTGNYFITVENEKISLTDKMIVK